MPILFLWLDNKNIWTKPLLLANFICRPKTMTRRRKPPESQQERLDINLNLAKSYWKKGRYNQRQIGQILIYNSALSWHKPRARGQPDRVGVRTRLLPDAAWWEEMTSANRSKEALIQEQGGGEKKRKSSAKRYSKYITNGAGRATRVPAHLLSQ